MPKEELLQPSPDAGGAGEGAPVARPSPLDWALYILGAVRRRWLVTIGVFLLGVAACLAYYALKTPLYRVDARILVQRQQAASSVLRSVGGADEAPVRSAWEIVHKRENLLAIIKETKLFTEEAGDTSPKLGILDRQPQRGRTASSSSDPLEALIFRLDQSLTVATGDGTIDIVIEWADPDQAYALVEAAVHNYLEARRREEVVAIDEIISLLLVRAETLRQGLEAMVAEEAGKQPADTRLALPSQRAGRSPRTDDQLTPLKAMLDAKERAVADVEEFRRRRLAELLVKLNAERAVYSDRHPEIVSLQQDIAALSAPSPQLAALQAEERELRQEYQSRLSQGRRGGKSGGASYPAGTPALAAATAAVTPTGVPLESERVRDARFQYQQMLERINAAQVELDAARSAFKYRYSLVWPPQVPTTPVSPKASKIIGLGSLAAVFLAVGFAALCDIVAGRVVARWQIEKGLGLSILAEI